MGQNAIVIKGAREHNLKDIDLSIPRDELVVITGLSGSGKSSLAFDPMYAEGQRGEPVQLRAHVPGPDVEARPRQHRRPVAGGVHRPEDHVEEPALDGGHHHRDLRLPAPPVRARGRAALPRVRPRHQEADHRPGDRRDPRPRARCEGHHHGSRGGGPQGRVHEAVRRPAEGGLQPRAHRWRDREAGRRAAHAQQEDQALHRRGGGPRAA